VPSLVQNSYGKSEVRLTRVTRRGDQHDLTEVRIDIELEGDFDSTYTEGDNSNVVATDTMKNTVYALARGFDFDAIENFGLLLARHFVGEFDQVESAEVRISEKAWNRLEVGGSPHPHAFIGGSTEERTCVIMHSADETLVEAGLEDMLLLKTTESGFSDFVRDQYTTLPDTDDRILATNVSASWLYDEDDLNWNKCYAKIRSGMLAAFTDHYSKSVQQTLYRMGASVFESCPHTLEVTLELPNSHRLLVDLAPFGKDNPNVIFVATEEPYGMISGTMTRD
jgi:urate oxidase